MDIVAIVNAHARRGSEKVVRSLQDAFPKATVLRTESTEHARRFAEQLCKEPPDLVLAAGGDGTALLIVNAMRASLRKAGGAGRAPLFGMLPLGTGNAWAHTTGAPRWDECVERLCEALRRESPLPKRRFDLVEVEGMLAHFVGTGWDAEMIDDFYRQQQGFSVLTPSARKGVLGYLQGMVLYTIPRHVLAKTHAEVELANTGDDTYTVDDEGRAVRMDNKGPGAVLYRGFQSVCAAGTTPEWGYHFRAFPFVGLLPRRMCVRIYAASAIEGTFRSGALWRGVHPMPKMHTWLLTRCKFSFTQAVPFPRSVTFKLCPTSPRPGVTLASRDA